MIVFLLWTALFLLARSLIMLAGMSKPAPTRCRTLNWAAYNAAIRERGSLTVWFDPSTLWDAAPSGKRGGQPV